MSSFRQQVSSSIRILGWNRDASARATHLKAADGNVPFATIERKSMSTKTSIKRVALVAAAALTLGGFSAVSAHATSNSHGTAAAVYQDATSGDAGIGGVAGPANSLVVNVQQKVDTEPATVQNFGAYVTVSGAGATILGAYETSVAQSVETATIVPGSLTSTAVIAATGASATLPGGGTNFRSLRIGTPTAGTVTISVYNATTAGANPSSYDTTADATYSITVHATAVSGTLSVASSTFYDTTTVLGTASASLATAPTVVATNGTAGVSYKAALLDANGVAMPSSTTWSVTLTGPGTLATSPTGTPGARVLTGTGAAPAFTIFGDGSSGTTTITLSAGSTVVGTKTVTFYSTTVASLTATAMYNVVVAVHGGYSATSTKTIYVVAKDASGNAISASGANGMTATSSSTAVATVGTPTYDANAGGTGVAGYYVTVTGVAEGTATITIADSTGKITATAPVLVTTDIAASVNASTDAAAYDPGTAVVYTISATDAAGNPIADGTYVGFLATLPTTNVAVQGFSESTTATFKGGMSSVTFYAPLSSGNVSVTGGVLGSTANFATALQAASLATATFAVNGNADVSAATDAANAATDAANAAADAADNATQAASEALAAVNSLATTVASLIAGIKAQITSLTNLITKIKNKVGA